MDIQVGQTIDSARQQNCSGRAKEIFYLDLSPSKRIIGERGNLILTAQMIFSIRVRNATLSKGETSLPEEITVLSDGKEST